MFRYRLYLEEGQYVSKVFYLVGTSIPYAIAYLGAAMLN
jgi:hypothetical protein